MSTILRLFVLLVVASAASGIYGAEVADAPRYQIDDTWKFGQVDLWRKERTEGWTNTVESVSDTQVVMAGQDEKTGKFRSFYTLEGNPVSKSRRTYTPYMPLLSFPLIVGKKWEKAYELHKSDGTRTEVSMSVKVVAFEQVTVPAGTFDAFKLKYHAYFKRAGERGTGTMESSYWYAPKVKRIIREEYRDTTFSGQLYNQYVIELEAYKRANETKGDNNHE